MSYKVGLRLREIRRRFDLTQQQLGKQLGINASAVSKYETGIGFPTGKMLNLLASQYNVSMDYLVCGRGTMFYEEKDVPESSRSESILSGDKELEEVFSLASSISWVRYALLSYFQRFKLEYQHLIAKEKELANG